MSALDSVQRRLCMNVKDAESARGVRTMAGARYVVAARVAETRRRPIGPTCSR